MKKIILIFLVLGLLGFGAYVFKNAKISRDVSNVDTSGMFKKPEEMRQIMESVAPQAQADFVKDGNLRLLEEDEETQRWRLLYGEPGNPAAMVYLDFNNRSKCDYGQGETICSEKHFEEGLRVNIEGVKNGEDVTVLKLQVIPEN